MLFQVQTFVRKHLRVSWLCLLPQDAEGKDDAAGEGGSTRGSKSSEGGAAEVDAVQPVSWASFWTDAKVCGLVGEAQCHRLPASPGSAVVTTAVGLDHRH